MNTAIDDSLTYKSHEMRLHEINTLDWDELVIDDSNNVSAPAGGNDCKFDACFGGN